MLFVEYVYAWYLYLETQTKEVISINNPDLDDEAAFLEGFSEFAKGMNDLFDRAFSGVTREQVEAGTF